MRLFLSGLVVLLFLLNNTQLNAQPQKNAFDKAVDYCYCRIAIAYARTFPDDPERSSFDNFISKVSCDTTAPIQAEALKDMLNEHEFGTVANKFIIFKSIKDTYDSKWTIDEATKRIREPIFSNSQLTNILTKSQLNEDQEQLENDVVAILKSGYNSNSIVITTPLPNDSLSTLYYSLKAQVDELEQSRRIPIILYAILVMPYVLLGLILFFGRTRRRLGFVLSGGKGRKRSTKDSSKAQPEANVANNEDDDVDQNELNRKIEELKAKVDANTRSTSLILNDVNNLKSTLSPSSIDLGRVRSGLIDNGKAYYATMPTQNGEFSSSLSENLQPGVSFYKLIIEPGGRTASFEFLSEEWTIAEAIREPRFILYPVCKFKNNTLPDDKTKEIRTVGKGKLLLQNDKWVLGTKAELICQ